MILPKFFLWYNYFGMKNIRNIILGLSIFAFLFLLSSLVASAADVLILENPLGDVDSIPVLVNRLLKGLFGIIGVVALLVFMYGGFTWMTAQGAEKKIKQGWDTMSWGAIGLAVIFGSYIIVQFLLTIFLTETTDTTGGAGGGAGTTGGSPGGGGPAKLTP